MTLLATQCAKRAYRSLARPPMRVPSLSKGLLKSVGFSATLTLNLASAYVEVRDENRRSRRTDYRLG